MSEDQVTPDEVAALLRTLHESAAKLLADQGGELYPVASALGADGSMPLIGADTGDDQPDPTELLELLTGALHEQAGLGEIRATAVCANVSVQAEPGEPAHDALRYRVEGAGIDPFFVYYVYERAPDGGFQFAEPHTQSAPDRLIFP
jgi:hypothetical protein